MGEDQKERMFPILGDRSIKAIPWAVIAPHEAQAQRNHSQSLDRLAQRGGLGPDEAVNVMTGEPWGRRLNLSWARAKLMAMVWQFERERMEKAAVEQKEAQP